MTEISLVLRGEKPGKIVNCPGFQVIGEIFAVSSFPESILHRFCEEFKTESHKISRQP